MSTTALDFSKTSLHDSPVGGESDAPGPEVFDSFKDSMGRYRTLSLFIEYPHTSYPAFFTLKKVDRKGVISLYRKYMEIGDPTEYQVAIQLFGSWEHWQILTRTKWFTAHLVGWRKELKDRMESERYHEMLEIQAHAKTAPARAQATKWLADRYGGSADKTSKRGRPSKDEKQAHLNKLALESEDEASDAKRIGLVN